MWPDLLDYQRDALIQPCLFWLRKVSDADQDIIVGEIVGAFYEWRDAQADAQGMVNVTDNALAAILEGGLLSQGPAKYRKVPVDEATPIEVAGPLIHDDIGLGFKLWFDGFPPFSALLERRGLFEVFSIMGLYSKREAWVASLISLNRFLTEHLIRLATVAIHLADTELTKKHARQGQLQQMRLKAAQAKKHQAGQKKADVRNIAVGYFFKNPTSKYAEAASLIASQGYGTAGSVTKLIGGTKTEALKLLRARLKS